MRAMQSLMLVLVGTLTLSAQTVIKAAKAHLGDGRVIAPAWVSVEGGRITAVSAESLSGDEVIDCGAGEITPGFIDAWSSAGLARGDNENEEGREVTPQVDVAGLYEVRHVSVKRRLAQGVTSLLVHPGTRAVISGAAIVVPTAVDATAPRHEGAFLCVTLGLDPAMGNSGGQGGGFYSRRPNSRMGVVYDVRAAFTQVREALKSGQAIDATLAPLAAALKGTTTVIWYTETEKEIWTALRLIEELQIPRNICAGAVRASAAALELKARGVPVLLGEQHWPQYAQRRGRGGLDEHDHDHAGHLHEVTPEVRARLAALAQTGMTHPIDTSEEGLFDLGQDCCMAPGVGAGVVSTDRNRIPVTTQARELVRAGVLCAFASGGDTEGVHLIDYARFAVRDGLDAARALSMLTLEPARILGIAANKGSLEAGKDADLVVFNGDPLSPGSRPVLVMEEGRIVVRPLAAKGE
ncbi:MAG: hypothetical protein EXS14_03920 [Planctomycetes bacterium]|nr:hypothetical protein [Planctomycetota bacterium]